MVNNFQEYTYLLLLMIIIVGILVSKVLVRHLSQSVLALICKAYFSHKLIYIVRPNSSDAPDTWQ